MVVSLGMSLHFEGAIPCFPFRNDHNGPKDWCDIMGFSFQCSKFQEGMSDLSAGNGATRLDAVLRLARVVVSILRLKFCHY